MRGLNWKKKEVFAAMSLVASGALVQPVVPPGSKQLQTKPPSVFCVHAGKQKASLAKSGLTSLATAAGSVHCVSTTNVSVSLRVYVCVCVFVSVNMS